MQVLSNQLAGGKIGYWKGGKIRLRRSDWPLSLPGKPARRKRKPSRKRCATAWIEFAGNGQIGAWRMSSKKLPSTVPAYRSSIPDPPMKFSATTKMV